MKNYVYFVNESHTTCKKEVDSYKNDGSHLDQFLTRVEFKGSYHDVFAWGNMYYTINYMNKPIRLFEKNIQYIELKPFGYRYIVEVYENDAKTIDSIYESNSSLNFNECYNNMKEVALNDLFGNVDIEQDFEEDEKHIYEFEVSFSKKEIQFKSNNYGKLVKYKIIN